VKQPWFQFYAGDWRQCPELRGCSLAARGLWVDLMARAHQSEPYGHIVYESVEELALDVGRPLSEVAPAFEELERRRVFSRSSPTDIFSRRMVLDEQRRSTNRKNGTLGGNPNLERKNGARITDRIRGGTHASDKAQNQSQNQSQTPPSEERKRAPAAPLVDQLDPESVIQEFPSLDTPEILVSIRSYLAGRRERHQKAQTERGLRMALKGLSMLDAAGARSVIDQATAGGWLGWPPDAARNGNGHRDDSDDANVRQQHALLAEVSAAMKAGKQKLLA
jgi:hypothetical protein